VTNSVLWYTTRGAGVVSLLLLTMVVVLGVLSVRRFEAAGWPRFATAELHRNVSLLAVVFLGIHVVTAVVDPFTNLGWAAALVPFGSYYRTFWLGLGAIAMELLAAIVISSLLRHAVGHQAWRAVHGLAYVSWPVALMHGWGTGADSGAAWMLVVDGICVFAVLLATADRVLAGAEDPLSADRTRFRSRVRREVRR
jgi:sulfoxide reductase heme-binding subunit YedZ